MSIYSILDEMTYVNERMLFVKTKEIIDELPFINIPHGIASSEDFLVLSLTIIVRSRHKSKKNNLRHLGDFKSVNLKISSYLLPFVISLMDAVRMFFSILYYHK